MGDMWLAAIVGCLVCICWSAFHHTDLMTPEHADGQARPWPVASICAGTRIPSLQWLHCSGQQVWGQAPSSLPASCPHVHNRCSPSTHTAAAGGVYLHTPMVLWPALQLTTASQCAQQLLQAPLGQGAAWRAQAHGR